MTVMSVMSVMTVSYRSGAQSACVAGAQVLRVGAVLLVALPLLVPLPALLFVPYLEDQAVVVAHLSAFLH